MNTLSVVIPAFNEIAHLGECLDRLIEQSDDIHEIVVVDNNSTDGTGDLVMEYRNRFDRLVLVEESERGVVHARNAGFDRAEGTVIGRIDADTHVGAGWARSVLDFFERSPDYAAVTGPIYLYDSPWASAYRVFLNRKAKRTPAEQHVGAASGNNFAIRRTAWEATRGLVSLRTDLHEDIDLSLCMHRIGLRIAAVSTMCVEVSGRRLLSPPREYRHYVMGSYRTWAYHDLASRWLKRLLVTDMILHTAHWPLTRLLSSDACRVLPISQRDEQSADSVRIPATWSDEFAPANSR